MNKEGFPVWVLAGRLADWIADWLGWLAGLTGWGPDRNNLKGLSKSNGIIKKVCQFGCWFGGWQTGWQPGWTSQKRNLGGSLYANR